MVIDKAASKAIIKVANAVCGYIYGQAHNFKKLFATFDYALGVNFPSKVASVSALHRAFAESAVNRGAGEIVDSVEIAIAALSVSAVVF